MFRGRGHWSHKLCRRSNGLGTAAGAVRAWDVWDAWAGLADLLEGLGQLGKDKDLRELCVPGSPASWPGSRLAVAVAFLLKACVEPAAAARLRRFAGLRRCGGAPGVRHESQSLLVFSNLL